jgi:hypothetical protein
MSGPFAPALDLSYLADVAPDLMAHVVDIERLRPPYTGDRGGPTSRWETPPERTAVPCLILPRDATEMEVAQGRTAGRFHTVFFDGFVELGPTRRLVFTDPNGNATRYLYPTAARNLAEANSLWVADCEEYPSPAGA